MNEPVEVVAEVHVKGHDPEVGGTKFGCVKTRPVANDNVYFCFLLFHFRSQPFCFGSQIV